MPTSSLADPLPSADPGSLAARLARGPYEAYSYSYPHKSAYRPLDAPQPLAPLWAAEDRRALFGYVHVPFCTMRCGFCNLFAMAQPDGRHVWVNFAVPDYDLVQVIDTVTRRVVRTLHPGKAVLHMEFTPRGEAVWISARDSDQVAVLDTATFETLARLPVAQPSGIFFSTRAGRLGL